MLVWIVPLYTLIYAFYWAEFFPITLFLVACQWGITALLCTVAPAGKCGCGCCQACGCCAPVRGQDPSKYLIFGFTGFVLMTALANVLGNIFCYAVNNVFEWATGLRGATIIVSLFCFLISMQFRAVQEHLVRQQEMARTNQANQINQSVEVTAMGGAAATSGGPGPAVQSTLDAPPQYESPPSDDAKEDPFPADDKGNTTPN